MTDQDIKRSPAEQARINGAKSKGPTSPEGKARSSRNALTHGFAASINTVLTIEDLPAWELHIQSYRDSFKPQCYVEYSLVDQLASINWRQCRLVALETSLIEAHLGLQNTAIEEVYPHDDHDPAFHMVLAWYGLSRQPEKPPPPTGTAVDRLPREGHDITSLELVRRYLTTFDRQYRNVLLNLRQFRKDFASPVQEEIQKQSASPKEPAASPVKTSATPVFPAPPTVIRPVLVPKPAIERIVQPRTSEK